MTQKKDRRTLYGKPPYERITTRYQLPSGMVEEVFLEAQRRRVNPSAVLEEALREGLPLAAGQSVANRLASTREHTPEGGDFNDVDE